MGVIKSQFHNEYTDIIQEVNMHARNEFVQQYVDIPPVPLIRMQVLFLFLYDSGVGVRDIKNYLVPTILVQIGLDYHQEVTLVRCGSERELRTRQLTILAGDYLSGKYYQLLAQIEEVKLIRSLAESIYRINEWKTELYYNSYLTAEDKLHVQTKIDSALFTSFIPTYKSQSETAGPWNQLMEHFIEIERLVDELQSYKLGNIPKGYFHTLLSEYSCDEALVKQQARIEWLIQEIKKLSNSTSRNEVKEEFTLMIQESLNKISLQLKA